MSHEQTLEDLGDKGLSLLDAAQLRSLCAAQRYRIQVLNEDLKIAREQAAKFKAMYERTYRQLEIAQRAQ